MTHRRRLVALATLAAALVLAAPALAQAPDLLSDPPENAQLQTQVSGGSTRLLLRFDSFVHNKLGAGPLDVRATIPPGDAQGNPAPQASSVEQAVDGVLQPMPGGEVIFEDSQQSNEDGHNHYHLQKAARYSLWWTDGSGQSAPAAKVGFCLLDSRRVGAVGDPTFTRNCRPLAATSVLTMGVSPGWRDLYAWTLANQWVNVSNVVPGVYALHSEVDPDNVVAESDETNNGLSSAMEVRIPGYLAKGRTVPDGAATVMLDSTQVRPSSGAMAAPRYLITAGPAHGTIDKPVNQWFTDPVVRYVPDDPSAPVPDEFSYQALAQDSDFPTSPPTAKVTLGGGARVAISGAPQEMIAGTTVQLSAPGATTWTASAGGVEGGRFTAPATPGLVLVRAANDDGSADQVAIRVLAPPVPEPAPVPALTPPSDSALVPPRPLAPLAPVELPRRTIVNSAAQRVGRFVTVSVLPGRSGRLRVLLRRGSATVGRCSVRAVAGRSVTCRLTRPKRGRGKLRVVVELRRLDGKKVRQSVRISTAHVH